ncbi:MAG TPA: hypothetical protein VF181_08415 [Balneolaceae bacterium]
MNKLLHNLFELDSPESAGTKLQLRVFELFTVVYTLYYSWEWAYYIQRLSDVILPLGLANYIDVEFFFETNLAFVNAGLITVFILVPLITKRLRWTYAPAFVLFHIQYVVRFSQGQIPHSSNLIGFSLLGLALGGVFIRDIKRALPFAFGFTIFFTGLAYTSAGVSKLIASGLTWPDGYHLWLWIGEKSVDLLSRTSELQLNPIQQLALSSRFIATLILLSGILTELSAFLLWWKKFRPFIFTLLIMMTFGIYVTMNIFFKAFVIEFIIIGYPWNRFVNYLLNYSNTIKFKAASRWLLY